MMDLAHVLSQIGHPRVLLVGDMMVDRYTWGDAERVSPEAAVLVLRADSDEVRLGGAASVAALLRGLEAEVTLAGVLGTDASGRVARTLLAEAEIDASLVLDDPSRPTTTKHRFMARATHRNPQQVLRVDQEASTPLAPDLEQRLAEAVCGRLTEYQAVLVSDYAKGVCTPGLLSTLIRTAKDLGIPVIVDPARTPDYHRYRGAHVLKPNRLEARLMTGRDIASPQDAIEVARRLCEELELEAAVITLDAEGIVLASAGESGQWFPTKPRAVCDVTGAGDMALAMIGLCLAGSAKLQSAKVAELQRGRAAEPASKSHTVEKSKSSRVLGARLKSCSVSELPRGSRLREAVQLANVAAGLEVERLGVAPVSREEIQAELQPVVLSKKSAENGVERGRGITSSVLAA